MFDKNYLRHDLSIKLIPSNLTSGFYKCIVCAQVIWFNGISYFYLDKILRNYIELTDLTCNDFIIKNIIE